MCVGGGEWKRESRETRRGAWGEERWGERKKEDGELEGEVVLFIIG